MRGIAATVLGFLAVVVTIGLISQGLFVVMPALGAAHGSTLPEHSLGEFTALALVNAIGGAVGGAVSAAIAKDHRWAGWVVGILVTVLGLAALLANQASSGALLQYAALAFIVGGSCVAVAAFRRNPRAV